MARHVGVAALPVNNRPETGKPSRWSFPTAAGWFFVLMKDRRPGRRPRSRRRAGTHNQRPWLWVPAFAGTTRVGFVGLVSPKCAATALALRLTMSNSPSRSRGACLRPGFATLLRQPESRVGGAPRDVRVRARHPWGLHMTRQARRLRGALRPMTRDARLSALHRGDFGLPRPRFSHRHPPPLTLRRTLSKPAIALRRRAFAPDRLQRAPRSQVVVPGGRLPEPPGASGYGAATAGRHASLRIQDRL